MRAPERVRARVVQPLEQSLPLALGALALGAEPSPGDGAAGPGAERKKLAKATSKHLLQCVFSVHFRCVCVAHIDVCSRPHTHVCSLHTHTRVASHTHVCVLAHTHRCVSECSSGASFNASVQKPRNLRVDTSPTVLNRISLHHLSSSTCLNASQSLPRKKKYCIFSAPWARKHCARKQRNLRVDTSPTVLNRTSLHHLSSSTCLKASRSSGL